MTVQDRFLKMLLDPNPPDADTIEVYIAQADAIILGYLGLKTLPVALQIDQARVFLAIILYNRRGAEGEFKRIEADVVSWFETMPEFVKVQLRPFRNAIAYPWPRSPA